ncbi:MAG: carboxylesterase family protein, partial [Flavobacteriales bacterium]|nr:carboxylesterase family protein [Flavobacteriales bacterium]
MKNIYLLVLLGITFSAGAQCTGNRYVKQIFTSVNLTSDILYGNNFDRVGTAQDLFLDVYEANGDTETSRPLMIIAHGGNFLGGSKDGTDVVPLCNDFAKMGYVCASMSYRIGMDNFPFPGPDSVGATEAVIRAYHDMKAAIRFFYKNARENGNTYGIDTNNIFVAGSSAGAIAAVHVGYLDDISEIPAYVDTTELGLGGGVEGLSGNQGYPSDIAGVISLAGALRDTSWIAPGDVPILSIHSISDGTVPYDTDVITLLGSFPIVQVSGSRDVHTRAENVGITNCLWAVPGTDHPVHVGTAAHYDTTAIYMRNFMSSIVCGTTLDCFNDMNILGINEINHDLSNSINVFPNPVENMINIDFSNAPNGTTEITVLDA